MLTAGIFIGGKARRMGGVAKGLLAHPTEPGAVIDHVVREARAIGADVVLVGNHPAYGSLGIPCIADAVQDVGPAGGLLALLRHAGSGIALALACDMPYLSSELLASLVKRVEQGERAAVPLRDGRLEPLCAAYRADVVAIHVASCVENGVWGLHRIVRASGAEELELSGEQARWLDDWDAPEDVERRG